MLLFPYIENAFKYGVSYTNKSDIHITMKTESNELHFTCINTISKPEKLFTEYKTEGIGLINVKKRLDLLYSKKYTLEINNDGQTFSVNLKINLV